MGTYTIKLDEYGIDKNEYLELRAFCLQYPTKKKRLHLLQGAALTKARDDIELIERTAREVDDFLAPWLLQSVTEGIPTWVLITTCNMPENRDNFNRKRRKFFYLLAKNKNII